MRVFEAPDQTRDAVLSKYRKVLEDQDPNDYDYPLFLEDFDNIVSGKISPQEAGDYIFEELLPSLEALMSITTSVTLPIDVRRARGLQSIKEGQVEWLCNQFVPLESFGDYDSEITSDLIWPEDLPRAIETLDWFMEARKDSRVQNQFRLMFPEEISDGASIRNPLDWSCYQMEDVQDSLTPGNLATARNERWDPEERGFTPDEADVAYDQDGIMIVRMLKPRAATAYASGTRWCTSHATTAKGYLDTGPLYVVFDNGKKYAQAHYGFKASYPDDYVSFMDVRDREIDDASESIRRAVADTILGDAAEYHTGLLTVDGYIEQEYAKAVEKRDLEVSRARKAMENAGRTKILGSSIFANRFDGGSYLRDQAKRITDADDALADAMVKIGAKAEKAVFRSNLSGFTTLSHIQEAIDDDEGIGGSSTVDITMDVDDMDRILDTIVSNYTLWRNDPTFTDSGSNPSREEQMEAILGVADKNEIVDDRITQILIKIADWSRVNTWDSTEMEKGIRRYYKRLPSPVPSELAIALYTDMGDKDAGKFILRRANAATKRRLGRLEDDENDDYDISTFIEVGRINNYGLEDVIATMRDGDIFVIAKALRPIASDMATAAKAFDRLERMIPDDENGLDSQYSIPLSWSSRSRVENDKDWIKRALTARKHPPVNIVVGTEIEILNEWEYEYYARITLTLRSWNGEVSEETDHTDDWSGTANEARAVAQEQIDDVFIPRVINEYGVGGVYSVLNDWHEAPVDTYRLGVITSTIMEGRDDDYENTLHGINNYWVQLFMINYAFQSRFGHDAWETLVTGGIPGIEDDLLSRIMQIPINDTMTIGQYAESIQPVERNGVPAKGRHPGLLLTDDDTIADPSAPKTFRDFRGRQMSPAPMIKGTYLSYDINLASPDDHMDITNEILSIYQSGGQTIDHPAMSIFEGYFVEPHIPMSQRVVRQVDNKDLPKPPAILGYVCFNTRRWIEWDSEDGWTEMWRPGTKHRNRAQPDHVLAVMPDIKTHWNSWGSPNTYDSTFVPIRAGVVWCTACGGARPNARGDNSFTTRFATGDAASWERSNNKCYCGGSERYESLYDELAE